jgi:LmbE family N-acetylglucosaminyl deacetylase
MDPLIKPIFSTIYQWRLEGRFVVSYLIKCNICTRLFLITQNLHGQDGVRVAKCFPFTAGVDRATLPIGVRENEYPQIMSTSGKKTLLAIGAHYDDCIFGVPGILLKAVKLGYRVVILTVIGDYTNWAPVGPARQNILVEGARQLCEEKGVEARFLDYKSMHFEVSKETKKEICEQVTDIKPDLGLLLWPNDTHPDHITTSSLSNIAFRWSEAVLGKKFRRPKALYYYDNGPRHTIGFEPDTYVDISDFSSEAFAWIGSLVALVRGEESGAVSSAVAAKEKLSAYRGSTCGVNFSEALKSFNSYPVEIF